MIFDLLAAQWAHESLLRVTGGKNRYEYMYSGLPLMADMARSAFPVQRTHLYRRARVPGSSNSMLGCGPTTPKDYLITDYPQP